MTPKKATETKQMDLIDIMSGYVDEARRVCGVGDEWVVEVKLVEKPGISDDAVGFCRVDATYLNATIEFWDRLDGSAPSRRYAYHEVLHIIHQEVDDIVDIYKYKMPKSERKTFEVLYRAAVERLVQRLGRSMSKAVETK